MKLPKSLSLSRTSAQIAEEINSLEALRTDITKGIDAAESRLRSDDDLNDDEIEKIAADTHKSEMKLLHIEQKITRREKELSEKLREEELHTAHKGLDAAEKAIKKYQPAIEDIYSKIFQDACNLAGLIKAQEGITSAINEYAKLQAAGKYVRFPYAALPSMIAIIPTIDCALEFAAQPGGRPLPLPLQTGEAQEYIAEAEARYLAQFQRAGFMLELPAPTYTSMNENEIEKLRQAFAHPDNLHIQSLIDKENKSREKQAWQDTYPGINPKYVCIKSPSVKG